MSVNNFLPFCPTDTGTNLLDQSTYAAAADRTNGSQPGVASSKLNNRAVRQASAVTSQVAQMLSDITGVDVLDDSVSARMLSQLKAALQALPPKYTKYTTGSGNHNLTFQFFIAACTIAPTAGATYTNNAVTFTVATTILAGGTLVQMTGNGAPTVSGTLTKSAGVGDATLTFYATRAPLYLRVKLVGGGGGGGPSGTVGGGNATNGGNTTFGAALLAANGGAGVTGGIGSAPGAGGSVSLGAGPVGTAFPGAYGSQLTYSPDGYNTGGSGGSSAFGGAGQGAWNVVAGSNAVINTGSGGGGGGCGNTINIYAGSGGGAGGFIDALVSSPVASYAYSIGTGGVGATLGTSGSAGGNGAAGVIEVSEYYQ